MSGQATATLALLWERVRLHGDMPGFTRTVDAVQAALRGEDDGDFSMTRTVLSDPALAQHVLRLANSGMYAAFGQRVDTVSKAVLVLGTETIGHLALGLKLVEDLGKTRADSAEAHSEMEKAVLAGMVAHQVAASQSLRDPEAAVVCALLHSLGRMMATYYLPEHWSALRRQPPQAGEDAAARAQLGMTLEELGRAAALHWGLPHNLVAAIRSVAPGQAGKLAQEDWLAAIGTMSARCAQALWNDDADGAAQLRALAAAYGPMLDMAPERILQAAEQARADARAELSVAPLARPQEQREQAARRASRRAEGNRVMMAGCAELRGALGRGNPARALELALEAMHRGLACSRSLAFLHHRLDALYLARMGLGDGVGALEPRLRFGDGFEATVFHAALRQDQPVFIGQPADPAFAARLPAWWKATLADARAFIVAPLSVRGQPVGFLYGDWTGADEPLKPGPVELGLINELRALLARTLDPRWQADLAASRA